MRRISALLILALSTLPIHATETLYCFGGAHIDNIFVLKNQSVLGNTNLAEVKTSVGGVAYNMAHLLKEKQNNVAMVGIVGNDLGGETVLRTLQNEGIDGTNIVRSFKFPTSLYSGLHNPDGSLEIAAIEISIYKAMHADMLKEGMSKFTQTKAWILDSAFKPEVYAYLASIKNKPKIYLTICSIIEIQNIKPLFSNTEVLFGNIDEISAIAHNKDLTDAGIWKSLAIIAKKGVKTTICTHGPNGIYVLSNGKKYRMAAIPTKITKSTNGAGDALASGVINALVKDESLEVALQQGLESAAIWLARTDI